eukprot:5129709-Amphidinium_carterae.1
MLARSYSLYTVLASLVTGKALDIVISQRDSRNGFESWRLVVQEYEPPGNSRRLALLSLNGHRQPQTFSVEFLRWEEKIKEYERFPDCVFDEKAILLKRAPEELATYLQVTVGESTSYQDLRDKLESCLHARRFWHLGDSASSQGPAPMDIGGIGKGKEELARVVKGSCVCAAVSLDM